MKYLLLVILYFPLTSYSQSRQDTIPVAFIYDKPRTDSVFTEYGYVVRRNYNGQMKEIKWLLRNKQEFPSQYKLTDWAYFKN